MGLEFRLGFGLGIGLGLWIVVLFVISFSLIVYVLLFIVYLSNGWPVSVSQTISPYYAALLPRRGPHIASHSVCLSVCPSVCPSVPLSLPSVTSLHLANYNDTCTFLHALRAAYRTAISAVQILVVFVFVFVNCWRK